MRRACIEPALGQHLMFAKQVAHVNNASLPVLHMTSPLLFVRSPIVKQCKFNMKIPFICWGFKSITKKPILTE